MAEEENFGLDKKGAVSAEEELAQKLEMVESRLAQVANQKGGPLSQDKGGKDFFFHF